MRIILCGQGPFGEKVLEALIRNGEEVVGAFCPKDKRGEAVKSLAEKSGITLYQSDHMKDAAVQQVFLELKPDLVILAFVTDIIPDRLIEIPSIGTICYHPSLLPRHRGASGINWAIIHGDGRTGLTILWVDRGIDTGAILLQKEIEIGPQDTTGSLYFNKLFPMGVDAIVESVELIRSGNAPQIPQDESLATYEPPCDHRHAGIDWSRPAAEVYNLIRGCDPQPGAHSTLRGKRVQFYQASLIETGEGHPPGEVIGVTEEGITVALQGGTLTVGKLKADTGAKLTAGKFAREMDLKPGMRFGK
jgi:methionyl-tRNA formyltransferase